MKYASSLSNVNARLLNPWFVAVVTRLVEKSCDRNGKHDLDCMSSPIIYLVLISCDML